MGPIRVLSTAVGWLPWGASAFARARAENKPVLLSIAATWCQWCAEMDRTSYVDPTIATCINEHFVPVRVDPDERPDIAERYSLGGWPTTAFLDAEGAILGGGTYVPLDRMPAVLEQVMAAFPTAPAIRSESAGTAAEGAVRPTPALDVVIDHVFATFDARHGGFGGAPKFPLVAPLHLALDLWTETRDARYERIVVTSLDAMGWGGLYDEVDGGFFHYATAADWRQPHTEKLLETNAALIRLYLDAGARLGITRFTERAADALRYVQAWLAEPTDGGWFGSQQADDRYYATATPGDRRALDGPPVARLQFVDAAASMVSAALHAGAMFEDDGLRQFALTSLERVLLGGYKPGGGAAHVAGQPHVRGLLVDQAAMAAANIDAFEATGNLAYGMMAEELCAYAVRLMWDGHAGGFFDAVDYGETAVGLMRRRLKPFAVNCEFARTLARVARASGDSTLADRARDTVRAMAPRALDQGPLASQYVLAARELSPR
jgi:uncharacterized protein YyaL (SSP411 family)